LLDSLLQETALLQVIKRLPHQMIVKVYLASQRMNVQLVQ